MSELYNKIETLCAEQGTDITKMCRELKIPRSSFSELKSGRTKSIATDKLALVADYFNVSLDWLTGKTKYRNNQEYKEFNWGANDPNFEAAFDFANYLTSIRIRQDVSLSELGSTIGATEKQMQDIEEGVLPITFEQAEKLCEYLGTNVSQVLFDNQLYYGEVPNEYHDNVRAWEKKNKELNTEAKAEDTGIQLAISNPDIRMIARAGQKMTSEQAETLRKYAQFMFPEAFKND